MGPHSCLGWHLGLSLPCGVGASALPSHPLQFTCCCHTFCFHSLSFQSSEAQELALFSGHGENGGEIRCVFC
uniref:Secreted protein n=1 Tax=Prolemur simus TaxID=1328070 RepID=A0A8C9A211_PROSS